MAIIVVGGNGKDVGKTALVCAVIAAFPEFAWTAVKITSHDYESHRAIREETNPGQETDTARYLLAGARRALLVSRSGPELPIAEIQAALHNDRNVIYESNRILDAVQPDVCLALVNAASTEMKGSFLRVLRLADALVTVGDAKPEDWAAEVPRFALESPKQLSPEMLTWLRNRLSAVPQSESG